MHGLRKLRGALRRKLRDERGWALIDAVASSVVVVLAFVGTTMAFNGSNASVVRDQRKSQAMIVAQNAINEMRGKAQTNIDSVLAYHDTTSTTTYNGTTYNLAYTARYVTGLGSDQQDACGVTYSANGGTARYIYMRVQVTYAGQTASANANDPYLSAPASLDSYFSPEGGGVQVDTGTLRIYLLDRNANVLPGLTKTMLKLRGASATADENPQTFNASTGCYLFTGLIRDTYTVTVTATGSPSPQDIYMTNSASLNKITSTVVMPDRGALSRDIRVAQPIKVTPKFYVTTPDDPDYQVTYNANKTNAFFGTKGNWIAASDQIKNAPTTDFSYIPSGLSFMPHISVPSAAENANYMFPLKQGYSAYAGPCDVNNPNIGQASSVNNWVQVPLSLTDPAWVPGTTTGVSPALRLSQIRASLQMTNTNSQPTSGMSGGTTYYWGQGLWTGTGAPDANVKVRLKGDLAAGEDTPRCRSDFTNFNQWVLLGKLTALGTTLSDEAEALPVGTYDICVTFPWRATRATRSAFNTSWGSTSTVTGTRYFSAAAQPLGFNTAIDFTSTLRWPGNTSSAPETGTSSTTNCET